VAHEDHPTGDIKDDLMARIKALDEGTELPEATGAAVHKVTMIEVSAGDLRKAVKVNPDHPISRTVKASIAKYPDHHKFVMERADVQALLDNKVVETHTEYDEQDGLRIPIISKKVGDKAPGEDDEPRVQRAATFDTNAPAVMTPGNIREPQTSSLSAIEKEGAEVPPQNPARPTGTNIDKEIEASKSNQDFDKPPASGRVPK
jgi:hypothetical protein